MDWTTPEDINRQVLGLWTKGRILAATITGEALFPYPLRLKRPDTKAMAEHFGEARTWIQTLEDGARDKRGFGYEISWVEVKHRQLGRNRHPHGISIPTERDALRLIGKEKHAEQFRELARKTLEAFPTFKPWLLRRPHTVLEHAGDWRRVLAIVAWFRDHPNSDLYLRQLDIAGVDTKFIENRRGLLSQLIDQVVPLSSARDSQTLPATTFEQRYRLRMKPSLIRFRVLDERLALNGLTDLSIPAEQFARLNTAARRVFITENEVNGLAFPDVPGGLVIFGLGYGLDLLSKAEWLKTREVFYWGDIDTHGFAMLDQLRAHFPSVHSLLMDRETLVAHHELWSHESKPHKGTLTHLTSDERALFGDLQSDRLGKGVRLEQERIAYGWVQRALQGVS